MENRFEILLERDNGESYYLETYGVDSDISLNFNINDIKDISTTDSSYSKTILVPETAHNRYIFEDLLDWNVSTKYNPQKKIKATILIDTNVILEGNLQIKKGIDDMGLISKEYECVIYGDNDTFFSSLGESELRDLDFRELNHIWDKDNIINSWYEPVESGYFYPLIDYGYGWSIGDMNGSLIGFNEETGEEIKSQVRTRQLFPATRIKLIWDKIFKSVGYNYICPSGFLDSKIFNNLYIPFNEQYLERDDLETTQKFTVATGEDTLYKVNTSLWSTPYWNVLAVNFWDDNPSVTQTQNFNNGIFFSHGNVVGNPIEEVGIVLREVKVPFNDDTPPNGDPSNQFDTDNNEVVAPSDVVWQSGRFVYEFDIKLHQDISLDYIIQDSDFIPSNITPFDGTSWFYAGNAASMTHYEYGSGFSSGNIIGNKYNSLINNPVSGICFKRSKNPLTGEDVPGGVIIPINGNNETITSFLLSPTLVFSEGNTRIRGQIATDILQYSDDNPGDESKYNILYPGEKVWVEVRIGAMNTQVVNYPGVTFWTDSIPPPSCTSCTGHSRYVLSADTEIFTIKEGNLLFKSNNLKVVPNEEVDYNYVVPKKWKQEEFISSIIKMFNLYVEPVQGVNNTLLIETRDEYYKGGNTKDWTKKLDINQPIHNDIITDEQSKKIVFKYQDDNDYYNEDYTERTLGEPFNYGNYDFEFESDFIKGTEIISPKFSPSPLVPVLYSDFFIPNISNEDAKFGFTKHNARILYRYVKDTTTQVQYNGFTHSYVLWFGSSTVEVSSSNPDVYEFAESLSIGQSVRVDLDEIPPDPEQNIGNGYYNIKDVILGTGSISIIKIETPFISTLTNDLGQPFVPQFYNVGIKLSLPNTLDSNFGFEWMFEGYKFKSYPYLGHYDNPYNPNIDFNYGQLLNSYIPQNRVTNNNLYNRYWSSLIEEINDKDARKVTAFFNLTPSDISEFSFRDIVFIDDQYFRVNKIIDYNPGRRGLTQVELLKVKSLQPGFISRQNHPWAGDTDIIREPFRVKHPTILMTSTVDMDTIEGTDIISIGKNNIVHNGNNVLNIGYNNKISGDNSMTIGLNNKNSGNSSVIVGRNNHQGESVRDSIILGSNTYNNKSNSLIVNNDLDVISETLNINGVKGLHKVYNSNLFSPLFDENVSYDYNYRKGSFLYERIPSAYPGLSSSTTIHNYLVSDTNGNITDSFTAFYDSEISKSYNNEYFIEGNNILISNPGVITNLETFDLGIESYDIKVSFDSLIYKDKLDSNNEPFKDSSWTLDISGNYDSWATWSAGGGTYADPLGLATFPPSDWSLGTGSGTITYNDYGLTQSAEYPVEVTHIQIGSDYVNNINVEGGVYCEFNFIDSASESHMGFFRLDVSTASSNFGATSLSLVQNHFDIKVVESKVKADNDGFKAVAEQISVVNNLGQGLIVSDESGIQITISNITYSELSDLKDNNNLGPGTTYFITDRDIYIKALDINTLSLDAIKVYLCPASQWYQTMETLNTVEEPPGNFIFKNIFRLGIYGQTIDQGSVPNSDGINKYYAIWGGRLWRRDEGGADGGTSNDYEIDSGWTLEENINDSVFNINYLERKSFDILYDFDEDKIGQISDNQGNIIFNPDDNVISDFNNPNITNNIVSVGIYNNYVDTGGVLDIVVNNDVISINNNRCGDVVRDNICTYISDNIITEGIINNLLFSYISYNICFDIINNVIVEGYIKGNRCGSIYGNFILEESLEYNETQYDISSNIIELLRYNKVNGPIIGNGSNSIIEYNNINGPIKENGTAVNIRYNNINGGIYNCDSDSSSGFVLNIEHNQNNGPISYILGDDDDINVSYNINNGFIGAPTGPTISISVDITDTIVNK